MKLTDQNFFEHNWAEFVHIKYLRHILKLVANIVGDDLPDVSTIESINFKRDKYNEEELHVIYTDKNGITQDKLMKPAITDRVNELINQRFRWIANGDEAIKKLEIKDHYFKISTNTTQADFLVPYIKNNGAEQSAMNIVGDDNYITLTLTDRNTGDSVDYLVPSKTNFDNLKATFEQFKQETEAKDKEQDNRLTNVEAKNTEQDKRLDDVEAKNTDQDNRLQKVEETNDKQDSRLYQIEATDSAQDDEIDNLKNKDTAQDQQIKDLNDHQLSIDEIVNILQQKSHDFLNQLENPADFNSINEDGNYFIYANTDDNLLTGQNRPSDHWGILYNYRHGDNNAVQIYVADTDNKMFVRTLEPNGWSDWNLVSTSSEMKDALQNLDLVHFVENAELNNVVDGITGEQSPTVLATAIEDKSGIKFAFAYDSIYIPEGEQMIKYYLHNFVTNDQLQEKLDNTLKSYIPFSNLRRTQGDSGEALTIVDKDNNSITLDSSQLVDKKIADKKTLVEFKFDGTKNKKDPNILYYLPSQESATGRPQLITYNADTDKFETQPYQLLYTPHGVQAYDKTINYYNTATYVDSYNDDGSDYSTTQIIAPVKTIDFVNEFDSTILFLAQDGKSPAEIPLVNIIENDDDTFTLHQLNHAVKAYTEAGVDNELTKRQPVIRMSSIPLMYKGEQLTNNNNETIYINVYHSIINTIPTNIFTSFNLGGIKLTLVPELGIELTSYELNTQTVYQTNAGAFQVVEKGYIASISGGTSFYLYDLVTKKVTAIEPDDNIITKSKDVTVENDSIIIAK